MVGKLKKQKKIKLFAIGDGVKETGFSRVMHSIFRNLPKNKYEIHHLAINYNGDPHNEDWFIYPARLGGDLYGLNRIENLVEQLKPDLIFCLNDLWVLKVYVEKVLKNYLGKIPIIFYTPIDAGPIQENWLEGINGINRLCVYTKFAEMEVKKALNAAIIGDDGNLILDKEIPALTIIPHGVDTEVFFKFESVYGKNGNIVETGRQRAKRELYPSRPDFTKDSFIVLNANRNQPRKRIDITMKGFALFAENKPKTVKLYLHMGVEDAGWNVLHLAKRLGIDDKLILTTTNNSMPNVPDSRLNHIYNACDVGLNTSVGEGWGLVSFEHAATGAAQVVPNHSALTELWTGKAEMLEPVMDVTNTGVLTDGKLVTPESVAESLEKLYQDKKYLAEMSEKAYKNVKQDKYNWKQIAKIWDTLFEEVLNE